MSKYEAPGRKDACVLLFSGGRDSTIAAIRLDTTFEKLVLVTVTTGHLIALQNVKRRLVELRMHLPHHTEWVHVVSRREELSLGRINYLSISKLLQPSAMEVESCLPCQVAYFQSALAVGARVDAKYLAVGYTTYQSEWLEQTPYAIEQLRLILKNSGKELLLPSHDLQSKNEAQALLRKYNLTEDALEQKCLKQQLNDTDVTPEIARATIDAWAKGLERSLNSNSPSDLEIHEPVTILEVSADDLG